MNTMVVDLQTLSVTEQTPPCTGVAGDVECSDEGVYTPDGASTEVVPAAIEFGVDMVDPNGRRQRPKYLYLAGQKMNALKCTVRAVGSDKSFSYFPQMTHDRTMRYVLGAGIRDTHLAFSLQSTAAGPFTIERLSFESFTSTTRRL